MSIPNTQVQPQPQPQPPHQPQPRPLFLYGTLRALPLLAWAVTGDATKTDLITPLVRPGYVHGYARYTVSGKDYPATIKIKSDDADADDARMDGLLFTPQTSSQRTKLDTFEGKPYEPRPVLVTVVNDDHHHGGGRRGEVCVVEADMYVWGGDLDALSNEPWDLETFIRERLDDWLELFGPLELIGDEEEKEKEEEDHS